MINIHSITLSKYHNHLNFQRVNEHIYKQREDGSYRITLSCNLEEGESSQYPLEDILDKYYVNCTDYFEMDEKTRTLSFELEGSLGDDKEDYTNILEVSKLIGKHIYNKEVNGYVKLIIE